jgi:preprotein translocase subunit SecF
MASGKTSETAGRHSRDVAPTAETPASTAVEEPSAAPRHGFFTRLYTGTGAFDVIGRRRVWFTISGIIVVIAIASIVIRGFTFGIDFKGGTTVSFPRGDATVEQVTTVFHQTLGNDPESVVTVGNGNSATVQIRSKTLSNDQTARLSDALFKTFQPKGTDGKPSAQAISNSAVSSTWGGQITKKAVIALVVFLVLVGLYIMFRYERYMAMAALAALCFNLLTTAGVYSLVGFEVSPATVIGLLTILGFSLYDTVIVFDKVDENTHGFQHTTRRTFAEQANLAVNQTFMRSINTSLISVIPVLSLMIVAVWLLGVGTLKDLALVMLVGILVGTYSSIFFATPLLVTLRERTDLVRAHSRRVIRRRRPGGAETAAGDDVGDEEDEPGDEPLARRAKEGDEPLARRAKAGDEPRSAKGTEPFAALAAKPAPGARPVRPSTSRAARPSGKRGNRR